MKTIKESFLRKNLGLGKDELIRKWLDEYKITNYTINDDLTIDVDGDVELDCYKEEQLPEYIQFRKVTWAFRIYACYKLESLKGCPKEVGGNFSCCYCGKLTSLEGAPKKVDGDFDCNFCSKLTSLEGAPEKIGGYFDCRECSDLKSLKGAPKEVGGYFDCRECSRRFTKRDVKKVSEVKGRIYI